MKKYVEEQCLPLYNFPGPDEPDARVARAKLLLNQHAYLFQNPEVRYFMPHSLLSFLDLMNVINCRNVEVASTTLQSSKAWFICFLITHLHFVKGHISYATLYQSASMCQPQQ